MSNRNRSTPKKSIKKTLNQRTEKEEESSSIDHSVSDANSTSVTASEPSISLDLSEELTASSDLTSDTSQELSLTKIIPSQKKVYSQLKPSKPQVAFDNDGIPLASIENLNALTLGELEKYCQKGWVLSKHIDPLLIKLDLATTGGKVEKCQRLIKYKKNHPTIQGRKTTIFNNSYESFNWRPESTVSFRGQKFVLPSSSGFRTHIMSHFSQYRLAGTGRNLLHPDQSKSMFKQQGFTSAYLHPKTPYRSLLAFHGLGSGKTRNSIELANLFIWDRKKILVLLPGSLRLNFIEELYNWGIPEMQIPDYKDLSEDQRKIKEKAAKKVIDFHYDILTYNEAGVLDKLKALTNPSNGLLENRLIIVDEEHRFISRLSKEANIGRKIYYFLMDKCVNCKMLYMSGTPLINTAYELGLLFNILRGKFANGMTLFPESEEEFNEKFVNLMDRSTLNQELFKRRISGLVSYFSGTFEAGTVDGNPGKVIYPITKLPMSDYQYDLYLGERFIESKKDQKTSSSKTTNSNVSPKIGSSFRTYSRMVCNFAFPKLKVGDLVLMRPKPLSSKDVTLYEKFAEVEIDMAFFNNEVKDEVLPPDRFEEGQKDIILSSEDDSIDTQLQQASKTLSKAERIEGYTKMLQMAVKKLKALGPEVFSDESLATYSPKFLAILNNIRSGPGNQGLVYIYSEFRILEGITLMNAVLEYNGYTKIDYSKVRSFADIKKLGKGPRFGVISGEEDMVSRKILLNVFRHEENAHGEYLKVVLGTAASSEGIDLKRITQVHIIEPYWTLVRNDQVIGRAIRFGSHLGLSKEEQMVHVFRYQMTLTDSQRTDIVSQLETIREAQTTDEYVHQLAVDKNKINQQFIRMLQEGAVDCGLNFLANVSATPNLRCLEVPPEIGPHMYLPDINRDPEDKEYMKKLKHENFAVQTKTLQGIDYAFKVNIRTGRPIFDPPSITFRGKVYPNIITLYDAELLDQGIEIRRKYLVLGTHLMIDARQV